MPYLRGRCVYWAAVHGHATAMGCALAVGCDLAIASEDAIFQTPGVNIGFACIIPMAGIYRSVSRKKCLELIMTGEPIDACEAERSGLVNRVVPREKLEETAMEMAEKIVGNAPCFHQCRNRGWTGGNGCLQGEKATSMAQEVVAEGVIMAVEVPIEK